LQQSLPRHRLGFLSGTGIFSREKTTADLAD
jgi:hypothetical protein